MAQYTKVYTPTSSPLAATWAHPQRVIGPDPTRLVREVLWSLDHPPARNGLPPLWDGQAALRIVKILRETFDGGSPA